MEKSKLSTASVIIFLLAVTINFYGNNAQENLLLNNSAGSKSLVSKTDCHHFIRVHSNPYAQGTYFNNSGGEGGGFVTDENGLAVIGPLCHGTYTITITNLGGSTGTVTVTQDFMYYDYQTTGE